MRIAVDAMGGDHAPQEIVPGALAAAQTIDTEICLVGDESRLNELLQRARDGTRNTVGRVTIRHSEGVVGMSETPRAALQRGRTSSMAECIEMVKQGEAQAAVSAGNSGAFMALATTRLRNIADISRPAIAILIPTRTGRTVILDAGANADCKPEHLLQFATMGSCYAEHVLGLRRPRVAVLNIGEEVNKGNALVHATHPLLETAPVNFVGHIEGNAIHEGDVDVIVADGFVGNVVLKVFEGSVQFVVDTMRAGIAQSTFCRLGAWLMKPAFRYLRRRCDWAEYGGALLLGVNGVCVVGHGRSDRRAVCTAIQVAHDAVAHDIIEQMRRSVQQLSAVPRRAELLSDGQPLSDNIGSACGPTELL